MRIARDLGDVSQLLPEGVDHLGDCPYPLHQAIVHGLRVLRYEELPLEERPPKRIWMDAEKLDEHWKRVEDAREERYKIGGRSTADSDDYDDGEAQENAAAAGLVKRG